MYFVLQLYFNLQIFPILHFPLVIWVKNLEKRCKGGRSLMRRCQKCLCSKEMYRSWYLEKICKRLRKITTYWIYFVSSHIVIFIVNDNWSFSFQYFISLSSSFLKFAHMFFIAVLRVIKSFKYINLNHIFSRCNRYIYVKLHIFYSFRWEMCGLRSSLIFKYNIVNYVSRDIFLMFYGTVACPRLSDILM
jgi:hypothetical protein